MLLIIVGILYKSGCLLQAFTLSLTEMPVYIRRLYKVVQLPQLLELKANVILLEEKQQHYKPVNCISVKFIQILNSLFKLLTSFAFID